MDELAATLAAQALAEAERPFAVQALARAIGIVSAGLRDKELNYLAALVELAFGEGRASAGGELRIVQ